MKEYFIWDFWYLVIGQNFYCFFLYADYKHSINERHHFFSKVGFSSANNDLISIEKMFNSLPYGNFKKALYADDEWKDNTSIWSGDVAYIDNFYHFYYTSRDKREDFFNQKVFLAISSSLIDNFWKKDRTFRIKADGLIYAESGHPDDLSIQSWRDPYLFYRDGNLYMLVSAKVNSGYEDVRFRGCIGLMVYKENTKEWSYKKPIYYSGLFSECEVSEILLNDIGQYVLTFSCWKKNVNHEKLSSDQSLGGFYSYNLDTEELNVLLAEDTGIYACRLVPHINAVIGFNINGGGLKIFNERKYGRFKKIPPHT